jgi:adenylate cyclase
MNENGKYRIDFPREGTVYTSGTESILTASLAAGIPLFHACGGNARCSTCRVLVMEGAEWLTPPNEKEELLNEKMHFPPNVRLSCQTYVKGGPVKLRRIIQDETDIGLYVGSAAGASTQEMGAERELVLFFLDIRNFTHFVETHLAFDVIHVIRKLFSVFQKVMEKNDGKVIETMGDGLYAVFGCEANRARSAQLAVQSAHSMLEELEKLNDTYLFTHFQERLQAGIGVHIGKVVSGGIKIGGDIHTIVMGYPVNIAARLQEATKELNNNLVVSAEVYKLLADPSATEPRSIQVKGISTPLSVYLLGKPYVSSIGHNGEGQSIINSDLGG